VIIVPLELRFRVTDTQPGSSIAALSYSSADLRDQLEHLVIADLLGPVGGPEEIVDERSVRGRYLVGMLAPRGSSGIPEETTPIRAVLTVKMEPPTRRRRKRPQRCSRRRLA
jgi:hypothetical protein